ncbi:MAG: hypothetical protein VYD75_09690 [Pseudomonadota bacterium]|nr:hypothetical protein [Pseudomonadota bacterium]
MNVYQFEKIINSYSSMMIKQEVEDFNPLKRNAWIGLHDVPDNAIEAYILDSYSFLLEERCHGVVGFEWWFHIMESDRSMITFHADHDEVHRIEEGEMKYPMTSTCTYLDASNNPTIFLDSQHKSRHEKHVEPWPPQEAVFSFPDVGKMVIYDPTYIHGILPGSKGRTTLWYNVWGYKPDHMERVGRSRRGYLTGTDNRSVFIGCEQHEPTTYLGETKTIGVECNHKRINLVGPADVVAAGSLWSIKQ